jgi:hypothetical protein
MDNIYHRYLNLPLSYPKPKRFETSSEKYSVLIDEDVHKPFLDWLSTFGLAPSNVLEAFYTPPNGGRVPLHADTATLPGEHDICKINFTWGPSDSKTVWYKIKDESKLKKHYFGKEGANEKFDEAGIIPDFDISYVLFAEFEDADVIHEAVIDRPSLLNISQLHSTWNPSPTEDRWTLCFTLMENGKPLTFNRALEIFKDYIV